MTDLLKYYRLCDDLGVDFYREGEDDGRLQRLFKEGWDVSFLTLDDLLEYSEGRDDVQFDAVPSHEVMYQAEV